MLKKLLFVFSIAVIGLYTYVFSALSEQAIVALFLAILFYAFIFVDLVATFIAKRRSFVTDINVIGCILGIPFIVILLWLVLANLNKIKKIFSR